MRVGGWRTGESAVGPNDVVTTATTVTIEAVGIGGRLGAFVEGKGPRVLLTGAVGPSPIRRVETRAANPLAVRQSGPAGADRARIGRGVASNGATLWVWGRRLRHGVLLRAPLPVERVSALT